MYRDDLTAAHTRSTALELELRAARERIATLEGVSGGLRSLILSGAEAEARARQKERRALERRELHDRRLAAHGARKERRARRKRRRLSHTPLAWTTQWYGLLAPLAIFAVSAGPLLIIMGLAALALFAKIFALWLFCCALAYLIGRTRLRNEPARMAQLPFRVVEHLEALSKELSAPSLHIHFAEEAPSSLEMRALIAGLAKRSWDPICRDGLRTTTAGRDERCIVLRSNDIGTSELSGNRGYLTWYRSLVETGALALHSRYPIHSIEVRA